MKKKEYQGQFEIVDFSELQRLSIHQRHSKVSTEEFITLPIQGQINSFITGLPDILKGGELKELLDCMQQAVVGGEELIIAMGAHVIKCGLSPLIIELMKKKILTHLALNGAGAVHDFEVACAGRTSEEVADGLVDGTFGMAEETGIFLNGAAKTAQEKKIGFGEALAERMEKEQLPHRAHSLIYSAWKCKIPITIHVAIGTDIIHPHPDADYGAIGSATGVDFQVFAASVARLRVGALYCNIGSAVLLPEVFLKALTAVRNLGAESFGFNTANFDMKEQYRPAVNVLARPTLESGKAFSFIGHHEIMLPLLFGALLERIN